MGGSVSRDNFQNDCKPPVNNCEHNKSFHGLPRLKASQRLHPINTSNPPKNRLHSLHRLSLMN